jgi:preprotein translocase subunit SecA
MLDSLIRKIFGDPGEKRLRNYQKELLAIKEIEARISPLSLSDIQTRVGEIRAQFE